MLFFDYFSTELTYIRITDSLRRLYGKSLKFKKVDVIFKCPSGYCRIDENTQHKIMVEAEHMNKRCVSSYYLLDGKRIKTINRIRCNVVIALVVLAKLDMLHHPYDEHNHKFDYTYARELPEIVIPRLEEGRYNATYYDTETCNIITRPIRLYHNRFSTDKYNTGEGVLSCIISINYEIQSN